MRSPRGEQEEELNCGGQRKGKCSKITYKGVGFAISLHSGGVPLGNPGSISMPSSKTTQEAPGLHFLEGQAGKYIFDP